MWSMPWHLSVQLPDRKPVLSYSRRPVDDFCTMRMSKLISLLLCIVEPWAEEMP